MSKKNNVLIQGAIDLEDPSPKHRSQLILQLMWPALAENILSTLVSMADTIMVSSLGTNAISAVGLVTQPRFIMISAFMALSTGTTALIARAIGQGDRRQADHLLRQSLQLALALLVVVCGAMYAFRLPLIRLMAGGNIAETTVAMADDYFRIQIAGFPLLGLTYVMNAALRGAGNTRAAFYTNTVSNLVNIAGNYLLITGRFGFPAMGIQGASLATVIGQAAAFLLCARLLLSGKQQIQLDKKLFAHTDSAAIRAIAHVGMPALLEQLLLRTGMMVFTMIVTSLGDDAYASHIIAMNIQSLSFSTGMSFGVAATTLTGQCLGRRKPDLARWYVNQAIHFGYAVSVLVSLLIFFFGSDLASLYAREDKGAVIAAAALMLKIIAVINPISNTRFVLNAALRGAGDSKFTAFATFCGVVLLRPLVACLLVFVLHMGLLGVWIALSSDALLCYLLARYRWHSGRWAFALKNTLLQHSDNPCV